MKIYIYIFCLVAIVSSCRTLNKWQETKLVPKGTMLYKYIPRRGPSAATTVAAAEGVDTLLIIKTRKCNKVKISESDGKLTITPIDERTLLFNSDTLKWPRANIINGPVDNKFYFLETKHATPRLNTASTVFYEPQTLKFFDAKPFLQSVSIPFKIRPKISDKIRGTVETSVNLGLALGWKFSLNVFHPYKNIFGQNTNRYSLSVGATFGAGSADLSDKTTNPTIPNNRKALTITPAGFLMFGFNSVNVGFACGGDFATGYKAADWFYHKRAWYGIAFGIDILK